MRDRSYKTALLKRYSSQDINRKMSNKLDNIIRVYFHEGMKSHMPLPEIMTQNHSNTSS